MRRKTLPVNSYKKKKIFKTMMAKESISKNKVKSNEDQLSDLIHVEPNTLNHLTNTNIIYNILLQIKNFREFIILNDLRKDSIINVLNAGVLKLFKINEKVHKKYIYPQFYFLVLVGNVSFEDDSQTFYPGTFFGNEIIRDVKYRHTALASEQNTIILLIPKEYFYKYMKNNLINSIEKTDKLLINSFHIFKTFDYATLNKLKKKMVKIYPETGKIIISNQEIANAIYVIFKGNCALNIEESENLIILDEGDIFGIESLMNFEGELKDNKYLFNIINKSSDTIIFKFFINDLNRQIINSMRNQLSDYFLERKNIIQKFVSMKEEMKDKLFKKYHYRILDKKNITRKFLPQSVYKEFPPNESEKLYYKVLHKIRLNEKNINDKQKINLKNKFKFNKSQNKRNNLLNKIVKSKSYISLKENHINKTRKKIMSNLLLKKNIREIKKIIFNSEIKKIINDKIKEKDNKIKDNNLLDNDNGNQNDQNIINSKNMNFSFNSNKDTFFFTTINTNRKQKNIYKTINILSAKSRKSKSQKTKSKQPKSQDNLNNKEELSKTIMASTYRDSISYRNMNRSISAKKQIEDYGCTALDSMNYFNYGTIEKSIDLSCYESKKKNKYKKCIFYETNYYNIPLYILCDEKEKTKFPYLIKF